VVSRKVLAPRSAGRCSADEIERAPASTRMGRGSRRWQQLAANRYQDRFGPVSMWNRPPP
jgi:hypothetical protein